MEKQQMKGMVDVEEGRMVMYDKVRGVVGGSAVVVFTLSDCCMCHVAKQLLFGLGVSPTVIELGSGSGDHPHIQALLHHLSGGGEEAAPPQALPLPAIFIGGKFLGGIEALMACHINGSLVPLLKQAGALWL
uniref:Glutaredoxin domain-containing protein n=1 Tax=Opuntia streptacantha TaxID=393608 RepID=A0A7C9B062_OPUST